LHSGQRQLFWGPMWICVSVCEYVAIWCDKTTVHELHDCTTYSVHDRVICEYGVTGMMTTWITERSLWYILQIYVFMYLMRQQKTIRHLPHICTPWKRNNIYIVVFCVMTPCSLGECCNCVKRKKYVLATRHLGLTAIWTWSKILSIEDPFSNFAQWCEEWRTHTCTHVQTEYLRAAPKHNLSAVLNYCVNCRVFCWISCDHWARVTTCTTKFT
jgi:hypothetical protein